MGRWQEVMVLASYICIPKQEFYNMTENELLSLLRLQRIPRIGDITAKKLLEKVGSAAALFEATKKELLAIDGIGEYALKDFFDPAFLDEAEHELRYLQTEKITVTSFQDNAYPTHLKHCVDSPILLFSQGNINLKDRPILSIVGTRKATSHGIAFCEQLVEELAPINPVIVSGFAFGIDIVAHKAAIKNNLQTIACLAHGLNQIYPRSHAKYRKQVAHNGGFFTDFWSDQNFIRENFLKRNRIIAGLSEATLVIESAEKGGSLVTADIASSYNREVFAVPGRPSDRQSMGCNNLIKTQKAQAITSAADLVYLLNWNQENTKQKKQTQLFVELTEEEKMVFEGIKTLGKTELDTLALHCKMPTYKIASLLLNLELNGLIRPLPGKQYETV